MAWFLAAAVVFGAATHVFWDSFTHRNRWGFHQFPQLGETVFRFGKHAIELYELLRYADYSAFDQSIFNFKL